MKRDKILRMHEISQAVMGLGHLKQENTYISYISPFETQMCRECVVSMNRYRELYCVFNYTVISKITSSCFDWLMMY